MPATSLHAANADHSSAERPLRIAFLDSWLQQVVDGSGTAAAIGGLGQALMRRGHAVTRIAPTFRWPPVLTLRRLLYNAQLPALLHALSYDLIIGFDIDGFLCAGNSRAAPYVCSIKGVIAEELQHERGTVRSVLWGLSRLERVNARRAARVIATSDYCRRAIHTHYGVPVDRIALVPEGIDLPHWQTTLARGSVVRDPFTILCVARQYPRKHIHDLLHAFVQVRRRVPRARLVIIGAGPEHDRLRALAHMLQLDESTHFVGPLPQMEQVAAWYRRSTVFCLPSVQEGFGIVLLEAMASGLPVVSTTATAIPEVVPQRRAGILVPPAHPTALADALVELLEQPALRAAYGAFGQAHVQQFTWEHVAARFLDVVGSLTRF